MGHLIHTEIEIDAPAPLVWELLTDLAGYERWNPFVQKAEGTIGPGEKLTVSPRDSSGRSYTFTPTVKQFEEGRLFSWFGSVLHPALMGGDHSFELVPLEGARTRLIHDEVFSGLLLPLIILFAANKTRTGFEEMNLAIKQEAERRALTR